MSWTDEEKNEIVAKYQEAEPTPETSMEIVKALAEEYNKSPNGVRIVLSRAGVYVTKTPAEAGSSGSTGSTRVSKAAAQDNLRAALKEVNAEIDEDIITRLTGKAAVYFTEVINSINKS